MKVSGTIAGTGTTTACSGSKFVIAMDFAGTASVDIEQQLDAHTSTWIKIATGITADYSQVADFPTPVNLRLNCTAYTNDVKWQIESTST